MKLFEVFDKPTAYTLQDSSIAGTYRFEASFESDGEQTFTVLAKTVGSALPDLQTMLYKLHQQAGEDATQEELRNINQKFKNDYPTLDVSFERKLSDKEKDMHYNEDEPEDDDYDPGYGISGTGNEFQVFSTVIAIIKEIVTKSNPTEIIFTAKEPSRIKLYNRMAKLFARSTHFTMARVGNRFILYNDSVLPQ